MRQSILYVIFCFPLFLIGQNSDCGDRPIKPIKPLEQKTKEYKQSPSFLEYKQNLKIWKECMSPLAITERDDARISEIREQKQNQIDEDSVNPCGEKPTAPKRPKGLSIDDHRKTPAHILYRQKMKEWKTCMSPPNSKSIFSKDSKNQTEESELENMILEVCGEKPKKPIRNKELNHQEYKETEEYKIYQEALSSWKKCTQKQKNIYTYGPCGEKPEKPIRSDSVNHQEYKETEAFQLYKEELAKWKQCFDAHKD